MLSVLMSRTPYSLPLPHMSAYILSHLPVCLQLLSVLVPCTLALSPTSSSHAQSCPGYPSRNITSSIHASMPPCMPTAAVSAGASQSVTSASPPMSDHASLYPRSCCQS